jgi:uncharacterized protein YciI
MTTWKGTAEPPPGLAFSQTREARDMLYAVKARFRPGTEERRNALATEFSQHIRQPLLHIRFLASLLDGRGGRSGMLMLMESDGREQLQSFLDQSPYAREGLYEGFEIDELQIEAGSLG